MNQFFSVYVKMEQLPDEVKRRNKIKVGAKIPRYDVTAMAGYYKPLEQLRNPKGQIYFNLNPTKGIINSSDQRRADRYLQGINSYNLTSVYLLDYTTNANDYIFAYGNPNGGATFGGKKKRPNPFFENRNDGFLFVITPDWQTIEMLVILNGANTILGNAKALEDGVYSSQLETIRATAKPIFNY